MNSIFECTCVGHEKGWIRWISGGCFLKKMPGQNMFWQKGRVLFTFSMIHDRVMRCSITARQSVAGVIHDSIAVAVTVKTFIDTSGNAMEQTQKQRQHRLWLAVFDLGSHASLLAVGELQSLWLPWLLLWKKKGLTLCHPESADKGDSSAVSYMAIYTFPVYSKILARQRVSSETVNLQRDSGTQMKDWFGLIPSLGLNTFKVFVLSLSHVVNIQCAVWPCETGQHLAADYRWWVL